jgi:hypothetical protein
MAKFSNFVHIKIVKDILEMESRKSRVQKSSNSEKVGSWNSGKMNPSFVK